jgi:hypothetical protein
LRATDEALHLLDNASRIGNFASSLLKDAGLRRAAQALRDITATYWAPGTTIEKQDSALILRAPGSSLSGSVKGFAVLEKGAQVTSAVEKIVAMPGASISAPRTNEICL